MSPAEFFHQPTLATHRQYEALRAFFHDRKSAVEVAAEFGYTTATVYSLVRDFKQRLQQQTEPALDFFVNVSLGRKNQPDHDEIHDAVVALRKKYLSVADIKAILDAQGKCVSERQIYNIIRAEGFARLPRRTQNVKQQTQAQVPVSAPKTVLLSEPLSETFITPTAGLLCFLPYIKKYELDRIITESNYPGTKTLPTLQSILAFLALKMSNVRRYTADDLWCMDRGLGLFAGLNVLPKAAWFTSYSHRITRKMNITFLKQLHTVWSKQGLLGDTANLDFVAVPYWGDDAHLENNWSGKRHQALPSILAALAQDPDSGLITYGNTNVRHKNEAKVAVEFLDFYQQTKKSDLKYLVFDSKFTTYENLSQLDQQGIYFLTIRRRGKKIVDELDRLPSDAWKSVRVPTSDGKTRLLQIIDRTVYLKGYGKEIRQVAVTGHGKIKPALLITNDFELSSAQVIRKYAKRWLVEKAIAEQTYFFHLNNISSSMVIKVDFDLTMSILAHNLYRLLAKDLPGFEHSTAQSLYEKFISNGGNIFVEPDKFTIQLRKKRSLPSMMTIAEQYLPSTIPWLNDRSMHIVGATHS